MSGTTVFVSTLAHQLQETLDGIITDKTDGVESGMYFKDWAESDKMDGAYVDFLEVAGPGLASQKPEGVDMLAGTLREHTLWRTLARTYGLRMAITEEAMEDGKYKEGVKLARRLKRAMFKTQDIDMTNILVRGWNTDYPGGDAVPLFSTSHTLGGGGTFSNTFATPAVASRQAVLLARAAVRKLPSQDGVTEGYFLESVICPVDQESIWEGILQSEKVPESNFNEVNVVKGLKLGKAPIAIPYWQNTATNFCFRTSAEGAPTFYNRRRPRSRTWVNESQEVMHYGISARWAKQWTDARSMYGSQA